MQLTPWSLPKNEDPQLVSARTRTGLMLLALLVACRRIAAARNPRAAEKAPRLREGLKPLAGVLDELLARCRRPVDTKTPLSPLEVTALAELAAVVCTRRGLPRQLYALAVAFDTMLPTKVARFKEVYDAYVLPYLLDPNRERSVATVRELHERAETIRKIIASKATQEDRPRGRPFDPRTEGEAALAAGGWNDYGIALMTDPDQQQWQAGKGERRVSRRLARHRKWCSRDPGRRGPATCFFAVTISVKVNPRI
jgi:hypothetical protein